MVKPPKIIVTDIDEDPNIKRAQRIKTIVDWSALLVIISLLWLMAATRICFLLGSLLAFITSIIATIQFIVLIKSSYSRFIGNNRYRPGPQYHMPFALYVRNCKEIILCKKNKIGNQKKEEKDIMDEQIPKMHRPL